MPLNLYSSATTDSLLAAKLSDAPIDGSTYGRNNGAWAIVTGSGLTISDLSNAATSTLNAGVPTAGQALTFDGTDLIWATVGGGGGVPEAPTDGYAYTRQNTAWAQTRVNGYDNSTIYTGGQQVVFGYVIYEMTSAIGAAGYDPVAYPSNWTAISGPAGATGATGATGASGAMNYLDMLTVTANNAAIYLSPGSSSIYYGLINPSAGWAYNQLANLISFKVYVNGTLDNTTSGAYNYYTAPITFVTFPSAGDIVTIKLADAASNEATLTFVTTTY